MLTDARDLEPLCDCVPWCIHCLHDAEDTYGTIWLRSHVDHLGVIWHFCSFCTATWGHGPVPAPVASESPVQPL
jgi:hypothetical protein